MSEDFLGDRRKGLEDAFFAKQSEELLQKMRAESASIAQREALAALSGIDNDALLDKLVELGVSSETFAALSLVPLIEVAWADGTLDEKEREALLSAAADLGLKPGETGYALLEDWLRARPTDRLLATWKEYVGGLTGTIPNEQLEVLRSEVLGRARKIAEAAGGFLGLGNKISAEEQEMLESLEQAFR